MSVAVVMRCGKRRGLTRLMSEVVVEEGTEMMSAWLLVLKCSALLLCNGRPMVGMKNRGTLLGELTVNSVPRVL